MKVKLKMNNITYNDEVYNFENDNYVIRFDLPFHTWTSKQNKFRIFYIERDDGLINLSVYCKLFGTHAWLEITNNENKRDIISVSILFNVNSGVAYGHRKHIMKKMNVKKTLSKERISSLNKLFDGIYNS